MSRGYNENNYLHQTTSSVRLYGGTPGGMLRPPQLFGSFRQKTHQSAVGRLAFCGHSPTEGK